MGLIPVVFNYSLVPFFLVHSGCLVGTLSFDITRFSPLFLFNGPGDVEEEMSPEVAHLRKLSMEQQEAAAPKESDGMVD
jgi:hypothetical protein